jgi:hypothetical protein
LIGSENLAFFLWNQRNVCSCLIRTQTKLLSRASRSACEIAVLGVAVTKRRSVTSWPRRKTPPGCFNTDRDLLFFSANLGGQQGIALASHSPSVSQTREAMELRDYHVVLLLAGDTN